MRRRILRPRFNNNMHMFKKQADLAPISVAASASTTFAYSFKASDILDTTVLATNYDQYKLNAVKVTFFPAYTEFVPGTGAMNCPQIYTAIDLDTDTAPGSAAAVQEYKTCRTRQFNRPHSRYLKPRALGLVGVNNSGTSTLGVYNLGRPWLSTSPFNNLDIEHYGLVGCIGNSAMNVAMTVRVHVTYYIAFRNTK